MIIFFLKFSDAKFSIFDNDIDFKKYIIMIYRTYLFSLLTQVIVSNKWNNLKLPLIHINLKHQSSKFYFSNLNIIFKIMNNSLIIFLQKDSKFYVAYLKLIPVFLKEFLWITILLSIFFVAILNKFYVIFYMIIIKHHLCYLFRI